MLKEDPKIKLLDHIQNLLKEHLVLNEKITYIFQLISTLLIHSYLLSDSAIPIKKITGWIAIFCSRTITIRGRRQNKMHIQKLNITFLKLHST